MTRPIICAYSQILFKISFRNGLRLRLDFFTTIVLIINNQVVSCDSKTAQAAHDWCTQEQNNPFWNLKFSDHVKVLYEVLLHLHFVRRSEFVLWLVIHLDHRYLLLLPVVKNYISFNFQYFWMTLKDIKAWSQSSPIKQQIRS